MKVILLMAQTLDGKIARQSDHFSDWTGGQDKKIFVRISKKAGLVIMGSKTFDTINKPLPERKNVVLTRNKNRKSEWDNLTFTDTPPVELLKNLEKEGFSEAILAGGASVNTLFAEQNLIDEIIVTVCPIIFGSGLSIFKKKLDIKLDLLETNTPGADLIYTRYRVIK